MITIIIIISKLTKAQLGTQAGAAAGANDPAPATHPTKWLFPDRVSGSWTPRGCP